MTILNLTAAAQYDDWKGEVALDNADTNSIYNFVKNSEQWNDGDLLFGYELFMHPTGSSADGNVAVGFYVGPDTSNIRKITIEIDIMDFLRLFKRISIVAESRYKK
ncbi:hypothetical protein B9T11_04980 [Wohlfahrtiimonas chitiniclastica]|uniref:hypothetical protein n=1 Tax=Wohlfahrtiimonas chitiniclastica TaxID=400946 RepID=UPI000B98896C|nr:hypothetical protein [Wohlfahrtiimonas chitiniclastica]MBS7836325.1 hypothetical protein [Wohlfahrtiimonas chitiniclastica]OYQ80838.1 hypothetical protein B9T11_04980 [Wohlfahrtiimonas chitiniclastica]OYQ90434.1 hypothetical protein B9T10_03690 [Wohlfahrtiimonas chitiniclastica]